MNKNKFFRFFIIALLFMSIVAHNKAVFGWGASSGDGSDYRQLQETAVFFNNSGGILSAGDVVVLDLSGTGVSSGSTLGAYITTTTTADSIRVVGVVKSTSIADQRPVVVVTKGPMDAFCQNTAGTVVDDGIAVGTYTTAGTCDGGVNLGVSLVGGVGDDKAGGDRTWIWVDPTGAK